MLENDVFFLSGSDENSLKNVQAAEKAGVTTKELVDENTSKFIALKDILNITNDDFVRSTEERHKKAVEKMQYP